MPHQASDFSSALLNIVGDDAVILTESGMQPYVTSWRDNWVGKCRAVVRPRSTETISEVVKLCAEHGVGIVPQGGRTGVTGASQPHDDMSEIVLSLERMNRIRSLDVANDTMTVDAGCILENVRAEAEKVGRLFPLCFGSVGSCMIGGNISTNAGGVNVVRYGNMRSLVAGLEVVLPDGRIWNGLRGLRKDNSGYDLKQIFIGAEGTLGIITGAVLRLVPKPVGEATAFIAVQSPAHALLLLSRCRSVFSEQLTAFELIQSHCLDVVKAQLPEVKLPQATVSPWYVLVEVAGQESDEDLRRRLEEVMAAALEKEELSDGTIAMSLAQRRSLWHMREVIPEAHKKHGVSYKHDISVPVSRVPEFLERVEALLDECVPGLKTFTFGHLGDGNLHFNPLLSDSIVPDPGNLKKVNTVVHDLVTAFGGSISAEHGIGRLRRDELVRYKSPVELSMMVQIKRVFDPLNIMNPKKVLDALLP